MNTVKKIEFGILPQDFSPHTLPEIMKLAKKIKDNTAFVYERLNKPFFMETDRLIIRRFTSEDGEAVLGLSLDRAQSSMRNFDHQWPTDLEGCKGAATYFTGEDIYYAVCLKPSMKLIGFIAYNSVNDDGILDLGHVWHTAYQDNDHDTEALSLMTQYAFEKLGVNGVTAGNPLDVCPEQIAPLFAIGMEVIERRENCSFVKNETGKPITFTGCKMQITREQWEVKNPEGYQPKTKPDIVKMAENTPFSIENLVETFTYNDIIFEVVERPDVMWVGCLDYASNNGNESDRDATLVRFQKYLDVAKRDRINPDWSASLWVNYGCDDKPHGQMFAQETYSAEQDKRYELFTQPGGLWLKVRRNKKNSIALFGSESTDAWDYFVQMIEAARENGYRENTDVHVRVGYDCYTTYGTPDPILYAYIPVVKCPEGYQPKTKPEILRMAAENAKKHETHKAYAVIASNGGSYIDGIPMLKWGEWKDNSYCGCVTALLNAAGIPVSYEDVMGLSGVCWQAIMRDDWDPSSQMPQNGRLCEKNIGDALGIDVYSIGNESKISEQAKISLGSRIPVLMVGGRGAPEWTLTCGYAVENGQDKFFGRTYFDCQHYEPTKKTIENQSPIIPDNEIYTENRYFYQSGFPGVVPNVLTRFYDKKCKPIPRKQALMVSLETCIIMFEQQPTESHKFGYDAYDVLISGFELDDTEYKEKCGNDCYHIGSLLDARRAAYVYLENSIGLLDGENKTKLTEVTKIYKSMVDNLLAAVPYNETTPVFNGTPDFTTATLTVAQRRKELAEALKKNKELERQAREIVKDILGHWDI